MKQDHQAELRMLLEIRGFIEPMIRLREEILGASADADRATQASPQAPSGLGHTVSVPLRGRIA
jgi:hypothetical protein